MVSLPGALRLLLTSRQLPADVRRWNEVKRGEPRLSFGPPVNYLNVFLKSCTLSLFQRQRQDLVRHLFLTPAVRILAVCWRIALLRAARVKEARGEILLLNILSPRCSFRTERRAVSLSVEVRRWDVWFILTLCHHAALLSGLSSLNCRAVFQVRDFSFFLSNRVASGSLLRTNEPSGPGNVLWHQSHTCPRRDDTRLHGLRPNEMHAGCNRVNKACLHVNSLQCRLIINEENRDVLHKNRSCL